MGKKKHLIRRVQSALVERCGVDRVVIVSDAQINSAQSKLGSFLTKRDHGMRNVSQQFFLAPYGRVCEMVSAETETRLFISYRPRFRKLAAVRVAIVPDDERSLRRLELEQILSAFSPYRLRIVEFALDFTSEKS